MNRIIINNKTDLSDLQSINMVREVIAMGKISNDNMQYCYLTEIKFNKKHYQVSTDLRIRSDSFTIIELNG